MFDLILRYWYVVAALLAACAIYALALWRLRKSRRIELDVLLGFPPINVKPNDYGSTHATTETPLDLTRARIVVPSESAYDFDVLEMRVGSKPALRVGTDVPGLILSEVSTVRPLNWGAVPAGSVVALRVRNRSSVSTLRFAAVLVCSTVLEPRKESAKDDARRQAKQT